MISRTQVFVQSKEVTISLVRLSLCNEQNFPVMRQLGADSWQISVEETRGWSVALKNVSYRNIYTSLSSGRLFNFKMIDGALIQMLYGFQADELLFHRLAFFPSPDLEEYQNAEDLYEQDEIYADILRKEIVPHPIRFDFNGSDEVHKVVHHPKSHLTLGQYKNCRIPVSSPVTPFVFITFILRNFYNTAFNKISDSLSWSGDLFEETIVPEETCIPFLKLPVSAH